VTLRPTLENGGKRRQLLTMAAVVSLNDEKDEVGKAAAATRIESGGSDSGAGGAVSMFFALGGLQVAGIKLESMFVKHSTPITLCSSLRFVGWG
jgi:hypothetical protein